MKKMIIFGVVAIFSTLGFLTEANAENAEYVYAEQEILTCDDGTQFTAVVAGNSEAELELEREIWISISC